MLEGFGRRHEGQWRLELEEMRLVSCSLTLFEAFSINFSRCQWRLQLKNTWLRLYLAERGSLAVYEQQRRLQVSELYQKVSEAMPLDAYVAYAHLRRAGYAVSRHESGWALAQEPGRCEVVAADEPMAKLRRGDELW